MLMAKGTHQVSWRVFFYNQLCCTVLAGFLSAIARNRRILRFTWRTRRTNLIFAISFCKNSELLIPLSFLPPSCLHLEMARMGRNKSNSQEILLLLLLLLLLGSVKNCKVHRKEGGREREPNLRMMAGKRGREGGRRQNFYI